MNMHELQVIDTAGVAWTLRLKLVLRGGRLEVGAMHLLNSDNATITATLTRKAERAMMDYLNEQRSMLTPQISAIEPVRSRIGPRKNDDLWRQRATTMATAWAAGKPMVQALRELEPGSSDATYSVRITRARAWDRETKSGILTGCGQQRTTR